MILEEKILHDEEEQHPIEVLAIGRTVMADERTLKSSGVSGGTGTGHAAVHT
jgi:hypothetical protein